MQAHRCPPSFPQAFHMPPNITTINSQMFPEGFPLLFHKRILQSFNLKVCSYSPNAPRTSSTATGPVSGSAATAWAKLCSASSFFPLAI